MLNLKRIMRKRRRLLVGGVIALALYSLLGFFLAPWLIHKQVVAAVSANLGGELRLQRVAVNPFMLSLTVNGLELDDRSSAPVARIEQIHANIQLSSLFRWAWIFENLRLDVPQLHLSRDREGGVNLARLTSDTHTLDNVEESVGDQASLPRLIIYDLAINRGTVLWRDEVPLETVEHKFGPVTVEIFDLSTLPDQAGQQTVTIVTEDSGSLSWQGSLQLNPMRSSGSARVAGSHFGLVSAYIRHQAGLDIVKGDADVQFDYSVSLKSDGTLAATIEQFELALTNVLVRTYSIGMSAESAEQRDLLDLPVLNLSGGRLEWPGRLLSAKSLELDGARLSLYLNEPGSQETTSDAIREGPPHAAAPPPQPEQWQVSLDRFRVADLSIDIEDRIVQPPAEIGVEIVMAEIDDIATEPGARFPTRLLLRSGKSGEISLDGSLTLRPQPAADLDVKFDGVGLDAANQYVRKLFNVDIESGVLNLDGHLSHGVDDPLRGVVEDGEIVDLVLAETNSGARFAGLDRLAMTSLDFSALHNRLNISSLHLDKPYLDIVISDEGEVNLAGLEKVQRDRLSGGASIEEKGSPSKDGEHGAPIEVIVGRVVIAEAGVDFTDLSRPSPFSSSITGINGEFSTIATNSSEASSISLEGTLDEFGLFQVGGSFTPAAPADNTELNVVLKNVDLPRFSAYSVPLVGREISAGKVNLELEYQVTDKRLSGKNAILLRKFELGEKIPHPDAASLPLDLVVALLKDSNGDIEIDLPVRGDLDDPSVTVGGLVAKELTGLVFKIATSPFALLGKLIGAGGSDIAFVEFDAGRADLTPPAMETVARLAEVLAVRPELVLVVPGVYEPEGDGAALREAQIDTAVRGRIDAAVPTDDKQSTYLAERRKVLETLFLEQSAHEDPQGVLVKIRSSNTSKDEPPDGDGTSSGFDSIAYAADLRRELIGMQTLPETALTDLALKRAKNLKVAVAAQDAALIGRIEITGIREVGEDHNAIPMPIEFRARSVEDAQEARTELSRAN